MLPREENDLITQVGPGTPLNTVMRRYWIPALLSREIANLLPSVASVCSANLVTFRDVKKSWSARRTLSAVRLFLRRNEVGLHFLLPARRVVEGEC
jgi:hypothetical protein